MTQDFLQNTPWKGPALDADGVGDSDSASQLYLGKSFASCKQCGEVIGVTSGQRERYKQCKIHSLTKRHNKIRM